MNTSKPSNNFSNAKNEGEFVKVCPNCKSSNIKQRVPQLVNSWFCLTCGNSDFFPIEINKKELK